MIVLRGVIGVQRSRKRLSDQKKLELPDDQNWIRLDW